MQRSKMIEAKQYVPYDPNHYRRVLRQLKDLGPDWDGMGSAPITTDCFNVAREILEVFEMMIDHQAPQSLIENIKPLNCGSISFTFQSKKTFQIDIDTEGDVYLCEGEDFSVVTNICEMSTIDIVCLIADRLKVPIANSSQDHSRLDQLW